MFSITVLSVCNEVKLFDTSSVFIDIAFQQKTCLCTISSINNDTKLAIDYIDISNRSNIKNFKISINDVFLNSTVNSTQTTFTGEIKLVYNTSPPRVKGGVCLRIESGLC